MSRNDSMQTQGRVLIAAGGTGGHVFPALAVAQSLRDKGCDVNWLGTKKGIESKVVPESGLPIDFLNVVGLRGKGLIYWLKAPLLMLVAVVVAMRKIRKIRPHCVLAMGGFASAAAGLAAFFTRTPLLVHEQNAIVGTTNKLLTPLATKVYTGFPDVLSGSGKAIFSGNPLRRPFYSVPEPAQRHFDDSVCRVVVVGGSLGAQFLNSTLPIAFGLIVEWAAADELPEGHGLRGKQIEILHQTGADAVDKVTVAYQMQGITANVRGFVDDLSQHYAQAELVIARAGALTVAELAAVGVASLLIPYPHAIDDHQSANADWLVDANAACKVDQQNLDSERLARLIADLFADRERLRKWAEHAKALATPNAAAVITTACMECANG